ncbi:MAG TPA: SDR family oxidoreductase [Polyangia bacterium]|jgi:3-oxoacyl-[acyl-carrier protein] reductase
MDLNGKTAVVTGGASGIGLAIAQAFVRKGAKVLIADVNEAGLKVAVEGLRQGGGQAEAMVCNVAKEADCAALAARAVERFGALDIAVLNAGILRDGLLIKVDKETKKPKGKMSLEQWQSVIDVNLTGVFLSGRECALQMVDLGKGGVIIPLSSVARHGNQGQTNYAAAKAGVVAMTVCWAGELARFKIRVASVAPGFIETPMVMKDMKPEALDMWAKKIPIGRLGKPEEIALGAVFIAENDLVTGVVLDLTGGIRL